METGANFRPAGQARDQVVVAKPLLPEGKGDPPPSPCLSQPSLLSGVGSRDPGSRSPRRRLKVHRLLPRRCVGNGSGQGEADD